MTKTSNASQVLRPGPTQCETLRRSLQRRNLELTFFKFPFFSRIVDLWNNLPVSIRTLDSFCSFKNKVNNFYFNKFLLQKNTFL